MNHPSVRRYRYVLTRLIVALMLAIPLSIVAMRFAPESVYEQLAIAVVVILGVGLAATSVWFTLEFTTSAGRGA